MQLLELCSTPRAWFYIVSNGWWWEGVLLRGMYIITQDGAAVPRHARRAGQQAIGYIGGGNTTTNPLYYGLRLGLGPMGLL